MTKKPYDENFEDKQAYQMDDDPDAVNYEYKANEQPAEKKKHAFKVKTIVGVVIVLVVAWFAYKVVHIAKQGRQNSQLVSSQASHAKKTLPNQQPVQSKGSFEQTSKKLEKKASNTEKQLQKNSNAISQLHQNQQQIQKNLKSIEVSLQTMAQQVGNVSQSVDALKQNMADKKASEAKKAQAKKIAAEKRDAAIRAKQQYYVQAVVPGRAWLSSASGETTTVAVGDALKGYGKVIAIDPYSGAVTTSSGIVIQYGVTEK